MTRITTIIYNKFDMDSTIAAAIARTALVDQGTDCEVYDDTQIAPVHGGQYIWIGVQPEVHRNSFFSLVTHAHHSFFNLATVDVVDHPPERRSVRDVLAAVIHRDRHADVEGSAMLLPTLMERVATVYHYEPMRENGKLRKLAHHVQNFLTIDDDYANVRFVKGQDAVKTALVFTYVNMMAALHSLRLRQPLELRDEVETDYPNFDAYLSMVKGKLRGNYSAGYAKHHKGDGGEVVVFTSISDEDYFWALRLTRMAHARTVNISYTMGGTVVAASGMNIEDYKLGLENFRPAGSY